MRGTLIAAAAVALLAGCSTYDSLTQRVAQSITPYRITVVQGNFVSKEAAAKMQVGMSRAEVKTVLGTPLLSDMFHADRWDYLFYFKRGSTSVVQQRDFIVNFKDDRVASWSGGDDLPSDLELLADIDGDKGGKKKKAAVATAASAASAAVASAPASEPVSTAAAPAAAASESAPSQAANEQAAEAANRAANQVSLTSNPKAAPRAQSTPPTAGQSPGTTPLLGQPQFQFRRPPPPNNPNESNPVGPTGSQSSDGSAQRNQPVTSSSQTATGAGS